MTLCPNDTTLCDTARHGQMGDRVAPELHGGRRMTQVGQRAPKVVLTDAKLKSLRKKPAPTDREFVYDGQLPGLAVMRTRTGAMSFGTIRQWPGKRSKSWRRLGAVYLPADNEKLLDPDKQDGDVLTLAEARAKLRRWNDLLSRGIDPAVVAHKIKVEAANRVTFDQLREAYLKWFSVKKKHGEAKRILSREFKAWEGRFADDIDAGDVEAAIQVIAGRGAPAQARNAFGYIRAMYVWAKGKPSMRIKDNPCDEIKIETIAGEKKSRSRWFSDDEILQMWRAADQIGHPGAVIKLLFLTAKRLNEIAHLSWSEIDLNKNQIIIPGRRMKGEEAPDHLQPLTPLMREILGGIPRGSRGDFVFSTTGGEKPMTIGSKIKAKIERSMPGAAQWGWHDIRRTARTNFSKLATTEQVREAMLAHTKKGLDKTYNLHDYAGEKADAYMLWETALRKVLNPPSGGVADLAAEREVRRSV